MELRQCYTCGKTKALDEFHRSASETQGRKYQCKVCATEATRRYVSEHRADPAFIQSRKAVEKRSNTVRRLALARLVDAHRQEYEQYLTDERSRYDSKTERLASRSG